MEPLKPLETQPINDSLTLTTSLGAQNHSLTMKSAIAESVQLSNETTLIDKLPDYSKQDRKVRKLQKRLARQVKGSNRRHKTRLRIAKAHNKIADTRKDFLHKLSTKVVTENAVIVLEDLNVSGMVKNRRLSRAISLQGWREFRVLCEGKSEKYGREFVAINRWEPTSQVCSDCGFRWGKLDLKVRSVKCLNCGAEHDRDENAAKNIEQVGMGNRHDSKWTLRDCKTTSVAKPSEASRITAALAPVSISNEQNCFLDR